MRAFNLIISFFLVLFLSLSLNAKANDTQSTTVSLDTLSDDEAAGLVFMREEEKLARDVYLGVVPIVEQPAGLKFEAAGEPIEWHFIGRLQSNKTRPVAERFDWVHSVDKAKLLRRLNDQRPDTLAPLNVCLQVNIDDEAAKSGVSPEALADLAQGVSELPRLRLRGLMCLPAIRTGFDEQRAPFARLRECAESLSAAGIATDTLSMGMTADYRAAIVEGATIVRLGTAIFGPRDR